MATWFYWWIFSQWYSDFDYPEKCKLGIIGRVFDEVWLKNKFKAENRLGFIGHHMFSLFGCALGLKNLWTAFHYPPTLSMLRAVSYLPNQCTPTHEIIISELAELKSRYKTECGSVHFVCSPKSQIHLWIFEFCWIWWRSRKIRILLD